jgi:hypothetical protein
VRSTVLFPAMFGPVSSTIELTLSELRTVDGLRRDSHTERT